MNNEEFEDIIKELDKVLYDLGDINMNCDARRKALNQRKLNASFDRIYKIKKHLQFLNKMEEQKNEKTKRKVQNLSRL